INSDSSSMDLKNLKLKNKLVIFIINLIITNIQKLRLITNLKLIMKETQVIDEDFSKGNNTTCEPFGENHGGFRPLGPDPLNRLLEILN
ncbi:MAG: hypothetical protein ACK5NI_02370, partial [bacterium]